MESEILRLVESQLGVSVRSIAPLRAGLGLRRFFRVATSGTPATLVARVEAPEDDAGRPMGAAPEPPLEPLRGFLEAAGLPVPARLGGDDAAGITLLEDVGDTTLEDAVAGADAARRVALYRAVLEWIPRLQRLRDPSGRVPAFGRRLDRALLRYKGELFARWSLPAALGRAAREAETRAVQEAFEAIADLLADAPLRLAHRDLQSHNVHVRTAAAGTPPRIALIDLQGAFLAAPEYDAVALLRDSYVELPWPEVEQHLGALRPALPDAPDPDAFRRRFDLLTLARKGKDHARFLYAAHERRDERWLAHAPATARALHAAAPRVAGLDPRLAALADVVARLPEKPCAP
jgi:aminoglycoside/choline kinase family phosphotransferase